MNKCIIRLLGLLLLSAVVSSTYAQIVAVDIKDGTLNRLDPDKFVSEKVEYILQIDPQDPILNQFDNDGFTKPNHPYLAYSPNISNCMHEDSYSSDISTVDPIVPNESLKYYRINTKISKMGFAGMSPIFLGFPSYPNRVITISFERDRSHLLLINTETLEIVDRAEIPGRKLKIAGIMIPENRKKLFRNTFGGAYSYINEREEIVIPIVDKKYNTTSEANGEWSNQIWFIGLKDENNFNDHYKYINLTDYDFTNHGFINTVFPDSKGNIWFTFQEGLIGALMYKMSTNSYMALKPYDLCQKPEHLRVLV